MIFAIVLSITLGITYWASKRATSAVGFYAAGRQITGVQNGLAISGDYLSAASFLGIAGLIYPLRVRRVPVLDRVPRRVPDRDVPARRAHAQRRQVHDRRRAGLPAARAAGAHGGGDRHAGRRRLLPDRADGRRGRADPGARGHRLHARGDPHRRLHALLRRLRRHGRHHVGADHQGRAADDRHHRDVDLRARQGRLQPDRAVQPRRGEHRPPSRRSRSARARSWPRRSTPCRSASRSCSAPPACRTS